MKILFCHHTFSKNVVGGSQVATYDLAKELIKRGHEVSVAYVNQVENQILGNFRIRRGQMKGVPSQEITYQKTPEIDTYLWLSNPPVEKAYEQIFREFKPDIFHIELLWSVSLRLPEIAKQFEIPTIFSVHDFVAICPQGVLFTARGKTCIGPDGGLRCLKEGCYKQIRGQRPYIGYEEYYLTEDYQPFDGGVLGKDEELALLKHRFEFSIKTMNQDVDIVDVPSKFVGQKLIENGVDPKKVIRLSYGLDLQYLKQTKRKNHNGFVCGFMGRFTPYKGIKFLIDTFNLIHDVKIKLVVAGGGTNEYEEFIKSRTINPNIKFVGKIPYKKLQSFLDGLDALIIPSLWNDTPLVLLAAQTTKTPVLVSNMETLVESVRDDVDSLIFKAGDSRDLISKIKRLTAEPGLIRRLSRNAPKIRNISEVARDYERIYKDLVRRI